jgi:hypothetical protein
MSYKLGKRPATVDKRTINLASILKAPALLPPLPKWFDVDEALPAPIVEQKFGNDKWGDCVIAARANQTLRYECYEQKKCIGVSEYDCLREYWYEQAGCSGVILWPHPDRGLNMLDAMKKWRSGWKAAGGRYNIYAFASPTLTNLDQIKYAIYLLHGLQGGIWLTKEAEAQFAAGKPWSLTEDKTWDGGHAVYLKGWNELDQLKSITWGKEQLMDWDFWKQFSDEAYAVVDDSSPSDVNPIDVNALNTILQQITTSP